MAGKFEIYKDNAGEFRFRLKARNGENILSSQGYSAKDSCINGVESVKRNATNEARFQSSTTDSGKFRFNLLASNGQVIGTSQNYSSESGRNNGIQSVGRSAPDAKVDDLT